MVFIVIRSYSELISGSVANAVVPSGHEQNTRDEAAATNATNEQSQPIALVAAPAINLKQVEEHLPPSELRNGSDARPDHRSIILPHVIRHPTALNQVGPGPLDGDTVIRQAFVMPIEYEIMGKFLQLPEDPRLPIWLGQVVDICISISALPSIKCTLYSYRDTRILQYSILIRLN